MINMSLCSDYNWYRLIVYSYRYRNVYRYSFMQYFNAHIESFEGEKP